MRNRQSGVMLLEAMIAILIFSLGVLGVVGMQAMAVAASRDAKYRADAALLANELIGEMWSSDRTGSVLKANFQGDGVSSGAGNVITDTDGVRYTSWKDRVQATLPGDLPPLVRFAYIDPTPLPNPKPLASQVEVTVRWAAPNDNTVHSYLVAVTII